jgi:hypothetical protein
MNSENRFPGDRRDVGEDPLDALEIEFARNEPAMVHIRELRALREKPRSTESTLEPVHENINFGPSQRILALRDEFCNSRLQNPDVLNSIKFLSMDFEITHGRPVGDYNITFIDDDNKQSAFISFSAGDEIWVFPNTARNFTEGMRVLWPELDYATFSQAAPSVNPIRLKAAGKNIFVAQQPNRG